MSETTAAIDTPPFPWRRNLYVMWATQLLAVIGFSVVMPILPLYVREMSIEGEQEVRLWSGIVYSAHAVTMAIFGPIWGAVSDRVGRKVMVERAMFGGAILIALMGAAQNIQQLMVLRLLQGAVTGVVMAANALIATTTPRQHAGYALGLMQMGLYAGGAVGPLIGGVISDQFGYRTAFYVTGVLLLLAGVAVLALVQERFEPRSVAATQAKAGVLKRLSGYVAPIVGSTAVMLVLLVQVATRLGLQIPSPVLSLFVEALAKPGARVATITGVISGASAAAGAAGAIWMGRVGDRYGHHRVILVSSVLSIVGYALHALVRSPMQLVPLQVVTGFAMGGVIASLAVLVMELAPKGQEGMVYGVSGTAMSIGNAAGPLLGSALAAWWGLRVPFLAAAAMFLLSAYVALRYLPRRRLMTTPDEFVEG